MSEPLPAPEDSSPRRPRGHALAAWVVILAVCSLVVWRRDFVSSAPAPLPKLEIDPSQPQGRLVLVGATLLLTAISGLFLLVLWAVFVAVGRLRLRLHVFARYGSIYAETFAVWMLLFVGLGLAASRIPAGRSQLLLAGGAMLLSLVALAWPVVRGVPWRRVRYDLGLYTRRPTGLELLCGFGTYAAALSMAVAGALVTMGLMALRRKLAPGAPDTAPSHPVGKMILTGDWWDRLQVLFAAAVAAPLVEETMFRGVLYRHLREASLRWGKIASIFASAALSGFVFAAIHPQGWLGIPPLMGLATVFALTREWRGSLLPSMVAHSLNNAVVTLFVIIVYG